jgi:two-component system, cell cycle sensor histidine kinase and response regulator CckA
MVYGIVKQHGGGIWVYSEPGLGTRVKIHLPRSDEPAGQAVICAAPIPEMPRGSETILVTEDNHHLLQMTVQLLERQGYRVIACDSAHACLDLVHAYEGPIGLLLTDVVMPAMNGRELYERLAALRPGLKVLYMSGYTDDVIAHRGILDDGVEFIQKPFSVPAFAQKVRELLDSCAS